MDNFEMSLVSTLLQNPKTIQELDINPDWFAGESLREVVQALLEKEGSEDLLSDIQKTMKQLNPLTSITVDNLMMLRDTEPTAANAPHYAKQVHKEYIERELKNLTREYSLSGDSRFLERITNFHNELESLKTVKNDGRIDKGYKAFVDRLANEKDVFIKSLPDLDASLGGGFAEGEFIVLGARPSVGKTAFGINIGINALDKNEGLAVDFFTLEMTMQQMMNRFIANRAKINNMLLRNPKRLEPRNKKLAAETYKKISKMNLRIYDQEYNYLNDIIYAIRKRAVSGKYLAIIDYAGLIKVKSSRKDERQTMNEVTRDLKLLTNELGITIILLAQLKRESERGPKRPTLADLKESGSLEQDANIVILLYKPEEDNPKLVKANIAKARDGITGELSFKYLGQFMEFSRWDGL